MTEEFVDKTLAGITGELSLVCATIERLIDAGYVYHFVLQDRTLLCVQNQTGYHQLNFDVQEILLVDGGITNNGITIFALVHREHKLKGFFLAC